MWYVYIELNHTVHEDNKRVVREAILGIITPLNLFMDFNKICEI